MSLLALTLLLVAATLHAGWNLLVKRADQKHLFTWLALASGAFLALPFLLVSSPNSFPPEVWWLLAASATVEAIYYITLVQAYSKADFSLVYPLARGSAPVFLAVWSSLFLGEPPRQGGIVGLVLIVGGLLIVSAKTLVGMKWQSSQHWRESGIGLALLVAVCISIYTVIDGAAVHMLTSPASYTVLVFALTALLITPFIFFNYQTEVIVGEWRKNWWRIIIVGIMTIVTYGLVLQAYALSNVSYAGAIREVSIVFATFVGWKWLGEDFGRLRVIGSVCIFAGIFVIAIFG